MWTKPKRQVTTSKLQMKLKFANSTWMLPNKDNVLAEKKIEWNLCMGIFLFWIANLIIYDTLYTAMIL